MSLWVPLTTLVCMTGCSGNIPDADEPMRTPTGAGGARPMAPPEGPSGPVVPGPGNPPTTSGPSGSQLDSSSLFACKAGDTSASTPRIWRLSPAQYANAIKGLVGTTPAGFRNPLQLSLQKDKFANYADPNGLDDLSVEQSFESVSTLAPQIAPALKKEHACLAAPDAACFSTVAAAFGERVFRRPLSQEETTRFGGLMAKNHAALGTDLALSLGIEAFLSSPHFLFRTEIGDGKADARGRTRLTPHEIAGAIAFTVTDAPPDAQLLAAAKEGRLSSREEIAAHVARLVPDASKSEPLLRFFREYLRYDEAVTVFKDPKTNPWHKPQALVEDTDLFVRDLLSSRKETLTTLLTSRTTFVRPQTAPSYAAVAPAAPAPTGTTPQKTELPADQRAGLLTHPSFLAAMSAADENDPIGRGKFIRTAVLCGAVPEIPLNVVTDVPDDPKMTLRERLQAHLKDPSCSGCHTLMDPLGFAFEMYDHTGRYRTEDHGKPVDTAGTLIGAGDVDGPFKNAVELSRKLAASPVVEQCFVRQAFRYLTGRDEVATDGCSLAESLKAWKAGNGDPVALMSAILASDSFVHRRPTK